MKNTDPSPPRRKVKFTPKSTARRKPPPAPKTEDEDGDRNVAQTRYLLRRATENLGKRGNRVEKKSSVQVAFGPGAASSSSSIRTYGLPKVGTSSKKNNIEPDDSDDEESIFPLPMDVEDGKIFDKKTEDGIAETSMASNAAIVTKTRKNYKEPWDYHSSYYPTTLPIRMPYSGDPELLDEAEFRQEATDREYDENAEVPALDLGLMEENAENTRYFFQLPARLPLPKQSSTATGKEKVGNSRSSNSTGTSEVGDLKKLPGGCMGKLLIYKSGAIKLRLGDTLYDVSSGSNCSFLQHVVAINTEEGQCCDLGDIGKRVIVTPDISSLLNSVTD